MGVEDILEVSLGGGAEGDPVPDDAAAAVGGAAGGVGQELAEPVDAVSRARDRMRLALEATTQDRLPASVVGKLQMALAVVTAVDIASSDSSKRGRPPIYPKDYTLMKRFCIDSGLVQVLERYEGTENADEAAIAAALLALPGVEERLKRRLANPADYVAQRIAGLNAEAAARLVKARRSPSPTVGRVKSPAIEVSVGESLQCAWEYSKLRFHYD